eukprot:TRINITY_DN8302_c0_g1_i1.p1 TRINITY_DN8302_c0_g1~~TRINITY_DN8302_c0_g1_i1.p1  ORF type:complete len:174 (-),score=29.80 TRINITY_DN8302_c0_g1_i1:32-499(-)
MPRSLSGGHYGTYLGELDEMGLEASAAPNSLWIKKKAVDKGMPVRWLARTPRYGFSLAKAVVFGDNPAGNDASLAELVKEGVPFFSVAGSISEVPAFLRSLHVGGLQYGTAAVLREMLHQKTREGLSRGEFMMEIAEKCRKEIGLREPEEMISED